MSEPLETWIDAAIGETREALVRDGKPQERKGHGRFLRCDLPEAAKPRGASVIPADLL